MKVLIPGGSGDTGRMLRRHFEARGWEVVVLSRSVRNGWEVYWDGVEMGDWVGEIDGADVVLNIAGRTVNCRYTEENLKQMMDSRVLSTRVLGEAIASVDKKPRVWLNASTATIYADNYGDAHGDDGVIGGNEEGVPAYWSRSIDIARAWEKEFFGAPLGEVRRVALRSAMTMSTEEGSVFTVFCQLAKRGLLGSLAGGRQYVSWIHEWDFANAIDFLIDREDIEGTVNLASLEPLPLRDFNQILREQLGVKVGLPAAKWMLEIGAWAMKTDTELVLKSRKVVSTRLVEEGFEFEYPRWREAARELIGRYQDGA